MLMRTRTVSRTVDNTAEEMARQVGLLLLQNIVFLCPFTPIATLKNM